MFINDWNVVKVWIIPLIWLVLYGISLVWKMRTRGNELTLLFMNTSSRNASKLQESTSAFQNMAMVTALILGMDMQFWGALVNDTTTTQSLEISTLHLCAFCALCNSTLASFTTLVVAVHTSCALAIFGNEEDVLSFFSHKHKQWGMTMDGYGLAGFVIVTNNLAVLWFLVFCAIYMLMKADMAYVKPFLVYWIIGCVFLLLVIEYTYNFLAEAMIAGKWNSKNPPSDVLKKFYNKHDANEHDSTANDTPAIEGQKKRSRSRKRL